MRGLWLGGIIVGVLLAIQACKHEPVIPDSPAISYQVDIKPIINANCTQPGCHGTVNPEFSLLSYEEVMDEGDIEPKRPENSKLYKSISGNGEKFMPEAPNPPLTQNQVDLIYWWILQGAKNN